jgi:hypothetical protein
MRSASGSRAWRPSSACARPATPSPGRSARASRAGRGVRSARGIVPRMSRRVCAVPEFENPSPSDARRRDPADYHGDARGRPSERHQHRGRDRRRTPAEDDRCACRRRQQVPLLARGLGPERSICGVHVSVPRLGTRSGSGPRPAPPARRGVPQRPAAELSFTAPSASRQARHSPSRRSCRSTRSAGARDHTSLPTSARMRCISA